MPGVVYSPGVEPDLYALTRDVFESFQRAFAVLERLPSPLGHLIA